VSGALGAGVAMLRRDAAIFLSYRTRVMTTIFSALFSVVLFHYISRLVHAPSVGSPDRYFGFVVVGLAVLEVLTSVVVLPGTTLRQELVAGTFERLALSPLGPVGSILALLAFPFAFSLVSAAVTIGGAVVLFGLDLQWSTAALAVPLAVLGALAFAPFGVLAVAAGMQVRHAAAGTGFVLSGISIVSGAYFPPSVLPHWLRWTFDVQPFSPAIELMRHVLLGQHMRESTGLALAKMAGSAVVLLPIALAILSAAVTRARRRGTLLEY
jgi:ABC-2 type transport system permease protein